MLWCMSTFPQKLEYALHNRDAGRPLDTNISCRLPDPFNLLVVLRAHVIIITLPTPQRAFQLLISCLQCSILLPHQYNVSRCGSRMEKVQDGCRVSTPNIQDGMGTVSRHMKSSFSRLETEVVESSGVLTEHEQAFGVRRYCVVSLRGEAEVVFHDCGEYVRRHRQAVKVSRVACIEETRSWLDYQLSDLRDLQ